eukprot:14470885-Alexandrium_andersonii.AAC.1
MKEVMTAPPPNSACSIPQYRHKLELVITQPQPRSLAANINATRVTTCRLSRLSTRSVWQAIALRGASARARHASRRQ